MRKRKVILLTSLSNKKQLIMAILIFLFIILMCTVIIARVSNNKLEGKKLIIDAGHGGIDGGANDGISFFEKDVNLQISLKLQKNLKAAKAAVDLTRSTDIALENNLSSERHYRDLLARVNMFNSGKYELFISIHVNRSSNSQAIGPIVLYYSNNDKSEILARCIQNSLNTHAESILGNNAIHKPVENDYFILRNSSIPGVIVETGFLSNPLEKKLLSDEFYQQKISDAIVKGIEDYYITIRKSSQGALPEEDNSKPFNIKNEVKIVKIE